MPWLCACYGYDNVNRLTSETTSPDGSTRRRRLRLRRRSAKPHDGDRRPSATPRPPLRRPAPPNVLDGPPDGNHRRHDTYTYDAPLGAREREPIPLCTSRVYGYSAATSCRPRRPRSNVTTYVYDAVGNLTQRPTRNAREQYATTTTTVPTPDLGPLPVAARH